MNLFRWEKGRQGSGYDKLTLLYSRLLMADAYILKVPKGVSIPKHTDSAPPHSNHFRINVTVFGHLRMETSQPVKRIGDWFSFFRPDNVVHWADAPKRDTYIFSFGWIRPNS